MNPFYATYEPRIHKSSKELPGALDLDREAMRAAKREILVIAVISGGADHDPQAVFVDLRDSNRLNYCWLQDITGVDVARASGVVGNTWHPSWRRE